MRRADRKAFRRFRFSQRSRHCDSRRRGGRPRTDRRSPGQNLFHRQRRDRPSCQPKPVHSRLIPTVLELGGKDAMIVLADANLDIAASGAVWGSFTNCGQVCLSVERIFVEQAVAEKFASLCVEKTKKLRLGPGSDPATDVGPLVRTQHVQRMIALIEDAVTRGAKVLCGGQPRPDLGQNFFEPTVIDRCRLCIPPISGRDIRPHPRHSARSECRRSRHPRQRLAFCSSGKRLDRRRRPRPRNRRTTPRRLRHDQRRHQLLRYRRSPHGGCGLSGWGRAHGKTGLLEMVQTKYIDVDRTPGRAKPWWFRYGSRTRTGRRCIPSISVRPRPRRPPP